MIGHLAALTLDEVEAQIGAVSQRMLQRTNEQAIDHQTLQDLFAQRNRLLIKPPTPAEGEANG